MSCLIGEYSTRVWVSQALRRVLVTSDRTITRVKGDSDLVHAIQNEPDDDTYSKPCPRFLLYTPLVPSLAAPNAHLNLNLESVPPHTFPMPFDKLLAIHLCCRWVGEEETVVP
jgi:hypothetical protein